MFLVAPGQCCQTEPKFRFLLMFKVGLNKIYPIFREANNVVPFIGAFYCEIAHYPGFSELSEVAL